jgi:putative tryptophan/tyrosine transport system substrate-binding protein
MKRRGFIAGLGSAAVWPLTARAQQPKMPVIGYLGSISPETQARALADFRLGLTETGYVEGRNVAIEFRWGGGQRERFAPLIEDLVRRRVAVIVVNGSRPIFRCRRRPGSSWSSISRPPRRLASPSQSHS